MPRRYVTLAFDSDDDYDPPLKHPADVFVERLHTESYFARDVGATEVRTPAGRFERVLGYDEDSAPSWVSGLGFSALLQRLTDKLAKQGAEHPELMAVQVIRRWAARGAEK